MNLKSIIYVSELNAFLIKLQFILFCFMLSNESTQCVNLKSQHFLFNYILLL